MQFDPIPWLRALQAQQWETAAKLLPRRPAPAALERALDWAAQGGHLPTVRALLGLVGPTGDSTRALTEAARAGHVEVVQFLAQACPDTTWTQAHALIEALERGDTGMAKCLIPTAHVRAQRSRALYLAAQLGEAALVAQLMSRSDAPRVARQLMRDRHWAGLDLLGLHMPVAIQRQWVRRYACGALPATLAAVRAERTQKRQPAPFPHDVRRRSAV